MIGSLYAAISGLDANATTMSLIGDNIANVNTTAFKSGSSSFASVLSQSLGGGGGINVGKGVEIIDVSKSWTQGSPETTGNPTDLAVSGRGFFLVNDAGVRYYTRTGQFEFDKNGDFVNPQGMIVQGYGVDPATGALGGLGDISIVSGISPAQATSDISTTINLDANALTGDTFSTSITVYDNLGSPLLATITLTNTATVGRWDYALTSSVGTMGGDNTGTIVFDGTGKLDPTDAAWNTGGGATNPTMSISALPSGATNLGFDWTFLNTSSVSDGSMTSYAAPSSTTAQSQDGFPSGAFRSASVDSDGFVSGYYSNGQLIKLYQIALADFPSYSGLEGQRKGLYSESLASGQPLTGIPGSMRLGRISPGNLEQSNVDLSEQFVKMITTQKAFQANAKVITASDEILTALIQLKR